MRNLCSGGLASMRSGSAQYAESRRDLLAAFTAEKHQITRSLKELAGCKALAYTTAIEFPQPLIFTVLQEHVIGRKESCASLLAPSLLMYRMRYISETST